MNTSWFFSNKRKKNIGPCWQSYCEQGLISPNLIYKDLNLKIISNHAEISTSFNNNNAIHANKFWISIQNHLIYLQSFKSTYLFSRENMYPSSTQNVGQWYLHDWTVLHIKKLLKKNYTCQVFILEIHINARRVFIVYENIVNLTRVSIFIKL